MKFKSQKTGQCLRRGREAMSLVEVLVATAMAGLAIGAIVTGYSFCANSVDYTANSMAANARAIERLEEMRSAKWDTAAYPAVDQLIAINFPIKTVTLDVSGSGVGVTEATIQTTISDISTKPPLKRLRVDCVWNYKGVRDVTNTVETCRAPDQ